MVGECLCFLGVQGAAELVFGEFQRGFSFEAEDVLGEAYEGGNDRNWAGHDGGIEALAACARGGWGGIGVVVGGIGVVGEAVGVFYVLKHHFEYCRGCGADVRRKWFGRRREVVHEAQALR